MQTEQNRFKPESWKYSATFPFVVLSTLLHAGVLIFVYSNSMNLFTFKLPSNTSLQITFLDNSSQHSTSSANAGKTNAAAKHKSDTAIKNVPAKPNLDHNAENIHYTPETNRLNSNVANSNYIEKTNPPSAKKIGQATDIKQRILKHVNTEIKKYIVYPTMARKRGWAGLVMIGFQLSDAGLIRNVHLFKSSGFPILDQSALNAFQQISHIQFIDAIPAKNINILHLPIEFQLIEG